MTVRIALLKGVNVGGNNKLPMADARQSLAKAGLPEVKSYIQSGNFLWRATQEIAQETQIFLDVLEQDFQIKCAVLIMHLEDLIAAREACPFVPDAPNLLHFYFPAGTSGFECDQPKISDLLAEGEEIRVDPKTIYHHTPQGFSKSKLAAKLPSLVSGPVTARNLNSIDKLISLGQKLL